MIEIELSKDKTKVIITKYVDGVKVKSDRFDPVGSRSRKTICESFGVKDEWLVKGADSVKDGAIVRETMVEESADEDAKPEEAPGYTIREIEKSRSSGTTHTAASPDDFLEAHLSSVPTSHVIEWPGYTNLCCLDIDYHGEVKPDPKWLETVVLTRLVPKPFCWHLSRSGGLHLFYVKTPTFTADELAAVAALRFRSIDAGAGLELKRVVRGPGDVRVHWTGYVDSGGPVLSEWFAAEGSLESAKEEWLKDRGIEIMGSSTRKGHSYCPICPTTDDKSGEPVIFSEAGAYCFVCEGKGRSMGSRRPGFAPWSAILGAPTSGDLGTMIRNICHWGHAKHVFREKYNMPEKLAKLAYRAALKAYHTGGPKELLVEEFDSENTAKYARVGLQWTSVQDGFGFPAQQIQPVIALFPSARFVTTDSKGVLVTKPDPAIVAELSQPIDQTTRGYPPIECVHGFKMAAQYLGNQGRFAQVTIVHPELLHAGAKYIPVYVQRSERMKDARAWEILETVVPRVDRTLVKLALCSFGTAQETRRGMHPMVFIGGISGTAKSSTLQVAAGILGAKTHESLYDADTVKFRQSIFAGASKCAAVVVNEMLKDAGNSRPARTTRQALDPLLNLTPDSTHHELYKGATAMGKVPALWITETVAPLTLREDTQIARRLRHIHVSGRKDDWKNTRAANNVRDLHLIRLASEQVNAACNAILSYVVDEFFAVPMSWDQQADSLGVRTVEDSENFDDPTEFLVEFFIAVCRAPDLDPKSAKRHGRGYKKISRTDCDEEGGLLSLYSQFADGNVGAAWLHARKLQEKDWSGLIRSERDVRVDMKDDGVNVFVRFASGPVKAPTHVNEELKNPEELVCHES